MVEDRGVDVLVRAIAGMDPRVQVDVVGAARPHEERLLVAAGRDAGVAGRYALRDAVPHGDVQSVLQSADILVLPMRRSAIGETYASPMKLFEYMAARRPIVASALPTTQGVVGDREAWFFRPDDPEDLAATVNAVIERWPEACRRAEAARQLLERSYTYDIRARGIVEFLRRLGILPPAIPGTTGGGR
jgi:glycosyltransferase involved in cell wall biosynthesis